MENLNQFDREFNRLAETRLQMDTIRMKLEEGMVELNELKRKYHKQYKELMEIESDLKAVKASNTELKVSMMKGLLEEEEYLTIKKQVQAIVEQTKHQLDHYDGDSNLNRLEETTDQMMRRYSTSNQLSMLSKIEDSKRKLIEVGIPPSQLH